jgi:hypothetical protein
MTDTDQAEMAAKPQTVNERVQACNAAILDVLKRHNCRMVAAINPPEQVGDGDKLLISAVCAIKPMPGENGDDD